MAEKLDQKEIVTIQELAYSNMIEQEALLRVLIKKGIILKEEFLNELKLVAKEMEEKRGE
jgi:hypothetical protein